MTDAQGIDSPKDGDGLPAPREAQEPGREAMRSSPFAVHPDHHGIVNSYVIRRGDGPVIGRFPSESDAIAACRLMNEMAGKK